MLSLRKGLKNNSCRFYGNRGDGAELINIKVNLGSYAYPVLIGRGIMPELGARVKELNQGEKLLLVSDTTVYALYGDLARSSLENAGFKVKVVNIKPGEASKNLATLEMLYDGALEAGLDRNSCVIALGGGVVGDMAGFMASTFLRGVPYVQVPTTLLAQVDSSVGGKVAVNHPRGKNLIGAFYQPKLVLVDIETLDTLNDGEYRAGMAEVIKYGIIGDNELFAWLEENMGRLLERDPDCLLRAVAGSVAQKAGVVESDEREVGKRRVLNLGHTFAHALEAATQYDYYLHGEAVLIGMDMAASLAVKLEVIDAPQARRIKEVLRLIGFKQPPAGLATHEVLRKLVYDKKREGQTSVVILPDRDGGALIYREPPEELIKEVIEEYLSSR